NALVGDVADAVRFERRVHDEASVRERYVEVLFRVEAFDQRRGGGGRHVEQGGMQRVLVEVTDELFGKLQRRQRLARPIVHCAQVVPAGTELHMSFAVDAGDDLDAAST